MSKYLDLLKESALGKRDEPPKDWSTVQKRSFYKKKIAAAKSHMKRAKETGNGGWQKMLQKRMATYNAALSNLSESDSPCWKGYEMVGWKMKNGKKVPNCVPIKESDDEPKDKPLNKPFRLPSGSNKKFGVYVKNDKGNVVKVTFGDPNLEIKRDDPERLKSFRARHGCDNPGPKWKAKYWSCRFWEKGISVSDLLKGEK